MHKKQLLTGLIVVLIACLCFVACSPQDTDADSETKTEESTKDSSSKADSTPSKQESPAPTLTAEDCLACHGPYEEIMAASSTWISPEGDTVNPHTTVDNTIPTHENPHLPDAAPINCTGCHTQHPDTVTSADQVEKPDNVTYCYNNCHHERNFKKCSGCH